MSVLVSAKSPSDVCALKFVQNRRINFVSILNFSMDKLILLETDHYIGQAYYHKETITVPKTIKGKIRTQCTWRCNLNKVI
jgi:hypothetical protein